MWLLWYGSDRGTVDFLGLFYTEAAAEKEKEETKKQRYRNGRYGVCFVEAEAKPSGRLPCENGIGFGEKDA